MLNEPDSAETVPADPTPSAEQPAAAQKPATISTRRPRAATKSPPAGKAPDGPTPAGEAAPRQAGAARTTRGKSAAKQAATAATSTTPDPGTAPAALAEAPAPGPSAPAAVEAAPAESALFTTLATEPYVSLTTFRRSGTPVPTPVWAAPDGGNLLVWTGANSGKVKRLRHTPGVIVAPCDRQGRLLGDPVPASARIMGGGEMARVKTAMTAKYGWQFRLSAFGTSVGRLLRIAPHGQIGIEVTLG